MSATEAAQSLLTMNCRFIKDHFFNYVIICLCLAIIVTSDEDDTGKTIVEIVKGKGYKIQEHLIWTEDGYGLTIHRLINESADSAQGAPVLFGVPLLSDATSFVLQNKHNSMAYYCADRGFDVWLANNRGNPFGRRHRTLTTKDEAFWDFTIIDHAIDLKTSIDYVLNSTGFPKVYYVGVSQGSTIVLTLLSMEPSYNSRFALLALFGAFRTTRSVVKYNRLFAAFFKFFYPVSEKTGFGQGAVLLNSRGLNRLCRIGNRICSIVADAINLGCMDKERLPVILDHYPTGTSIKNLAYYIQLSEPSGPRLFDYGPKENRRRYKNMTDEGTNNDGLPPKLKAELITAPIGLYISHADTVTPVEEFETLKKDLASIRYTYEIVDEPKYSHMCYVTNKTNDAMYKNFTDEFKRIPIIKVK